MGKKIIKASGMVLLFLLCALLLYAALRGIKGEAEKCTGRPGYDVILEGRDICALAFDGKILYAGGADGLYEIDTETFMSKEVGGFEYIRTLFWDGKGLWIGHDAGLSYLSDTVFTFTASDFLPDNRVNAFIIDSKNRMWIGTWGGAVMIDGEDITLYNTENGLLDSMVNVIFEDSWGDIWFGSYVAPRGGVSVLTESGWQYFTTRDGLLHANITSIIETGGGMVIVGGGLYTKGGGTGFVYQDGRFIKSGVFTVENGLAGEKIRSLFEDSGNRLWVGSEYDGLAVIYGDKSIILDKAHGLSCDEVKIIREDSSGNMWIGTRSGVTRIMKGVIAYE